MTVNASSKGFSDLLKKLARKAALVIHDPVVDRAAKQFVALVVVRVLLAAGASVELVSLVQKLLG